MNNINCIRYIKINEHANFKNVNLHSRNQYIILGSPKAYANILPNPKLKGKKNCHIVEKISYIIFNYVLN